MSLKRQNRSVTNDFEVESRDHGSPYEVNPEYTANMLLREAVTNAKESGMPITEALLDKVGLPAKLIKVAKHLSFHQLEDLRRGLKDSLTSASLEIKGEKFEISLAEIEMTLRVKVFIIEEITTPPDNTEDALRRFHSTIETAVSREADKPQKQLSDFFCPEKGADKAPEYDGSDPDNDMQKNLWVFPTRVLLWPSRQSIISIPKSLSLYREWMNGLRELSGSDPKNPLVRRAIDSYPDPPMNLRQLRYEVKDWLRHWKPVVSESHQLPNERQTASIELQKRQEIKALRLANDLYRSGEDRQILWRMAAQYLGRKMARAKVFDLSLAKRISLAIRRKFNARKYRPEGIALLPPVVAGDLRPDIEKEIREIQEKNPRIPRDNQFVIEVHFDAELREDQDHKTVTSGGLGRTMERFQEKQRSNVKTEHRREVDTLQG